MLEVLDGCKLITSFEKLFLVYQVIVLKYRAIFNLVWQQTKIGLAKPRGIGFSFKHVVVDNYVSLVIEIGVHHAVLVHVDEVN